MEKKIKYILGFCLIVGTVITYFLDGEWERPPWWAIITCLTGFASLISAYVELGVQSTFNLLRLIYKKDPLRVSMAYLLIIEFKGQYLLVKNGNGRYWQLPGGKFKFDVRATNDLESFGMQSDHTLGTNPRRVRDLAFHIVPKKLIAFLRWFAKGKDRETSVFREFEEEIVNPLNLQDIFPRSAETPFRFSFQVRSPVRYDNFGENYEMLSFDVFRCEFSEAQYLAVIQATKGNSDFLWIDKAQGLRGRTEVSDDTVGFNINKVVRWVMKRRWDGDHGI